MTQTCVRFLLILFGILAEAQGTTAAGSPSAGVFEVAARQNSSLGPAEYRAVAGRSEVECATICLSESTSSTGLCFGFYLLRGLCRLFHVTAFFRKQTWLPIGGGYEPPFDLLSRAIDYSQVSKLDFIACNQSSEYQSANCSRAIDGNTNQAFTAGSCSHTLDGGAWWEAQLSRPALVVSATVYNRQDCCDVNFRQFNLLVDGFECALSRSPLATSPASAMAARFASTIRKCLFFCASWWSGAGYCDELLRSLA